MPKFPLLAVVTLEGGGVFGFSLLGQLEAVIDSGIEPVAFAGTSAGAIIATLHWAGYAPAEIRDKLCELADGKTITKLMGPFDNGADGKVFDFEAFLALKEHFEELLSGAVASAKRGFGLLSLLRSFGKVRTAGESLQPHLRNRGFFCGEQLIDCLDGWLRVAPVLNRDARESLELNRPRPERITFGDFASATAAEPLRPLFLPVTNVTKRRLEVVCSADPIYANWPIARAGLPHLIRTASLLRR